MVLLSMNKDGFVSSFPIWMPAISFSCLIILTNSVPSPSTMLNRSKNSRHLYRIPDLWRENIKSFTLKNDSSCRVFTGALYQIECSGLLDGIYSSALAENLRHEWMLDPVKFFLFSFMVLYFSFHLADYIG